MKIAYLITAYKDPDHLKRLISTLENNDGYIHIDKKIDISLFKSIIKDEHVFWASKREWVSWAGYSQVKSILILLNDMISSKKPYDRVVCISGTDYPIISQKAINDIFTSNKNKEYLIGFNISESSTTLQKFKVQQFHRYDYNIKNKFILKLVTKCTNFIFKGLFYINIKKSEYVTIDGEKSCIYFGSDYWALTYECAVYVYEKAVEQKELMKYLSTAFAPSELFVHSIVFNSKYAKNAELFPSKEYKNLQSLTPLTYIIYNSNGVQELDESSFDDIISSHKLFFRKASTKVSLKLIDLIDNSNIIR